MATQEIAEYRKKLIRNLDDLFGLKPEDVTAYTAWNRPRDQWEAWILETLAWTCARIESGEAKEAFRGYAQAREYRGRLGGFWPGPFVGDAAIGIQNAIEDLISGKV